MHAAWVRFVATGNPGWPAAGSKHTVQQIGTEWQLIDNPRPLENAAWP
jgi:para-nitrobenzyl esterase